MNMIRRIYHRDVVHVPVSIIPLVNHRLAAIVFILIRVISYRMDISYYELLVTPKQPMSSKRHRHYNHLDVVAQLR